MPSYAAAAAAAACLHIKAESLIGLINQAPKHIKSDGRVK
jgi:hypothetical protein